MILLKSLIIAILGPGTAIVGFPYLIRFFLPELLSFNLGIGRFLGVVLMALGPAIYLSCLLNFVYVGQGTPLPLDPPKKLVVAGFHRHVRNPMFIGVILALLGEVIFFRSINIFLYAFFLWIGFHLFTVFYEEPNLRKKFGKEYKRYLKTVPRWIPRLQPIK